MYLADSSKFSPLFGLLRQIIPKTWKDRYGYKNKNQNRERDAKESGYIIVDAEGENTFKYSSLSSATFFIIEETRIIFDSLCLSKKPVWVTISHRPKYLFALPVCDVSTSRAPFRLLGECRIFIHIHNGGHGGVEG